SGSVPPTTRPGYCAPMGRRTSSCPAGPRRSWPTRSGTSWPTCGGGPQPADSRLIAPMGIPGREPGSQDKASPLDCVELRWTREGGTVARRLFTSESVTEGHPDKIADQISDGVLDALLSQDPHSRVAVETLITTGQVHVAGEVTTQAYADINAIV